MCGDTRAATSMTAARGAPGCGRWATTSIQPSAGSTKTGSTGRAAAGTVVIAGTVVVAGTAAVGNGSASGRAAGSMGWSRTEEGEGVGTW